MARGTKGLRYQDPDKVNVHHRAAHRVCKGFRIKGRITARLAFPDYLFNFIREKAIRDGISFNGAAIAMLEDYKPTEAERCKK